MNALVIDQLYFLTCANQEQVIHDAAQRIGCSLPPTEPAIVVESRDDLQQYISTNKLTTLSVYELSAIMTGQGPKVYNIFFWIARDGLLLNESRLCTGKPILQEFIEAVQIYQQH